MSELVSSLKPIRQLPEQLANQIAAGEVIERPASVVKELLENSLDAGASQIDINIRNGGVREIRVRDNGCGIPVDELVLALSRHATSKIEQVQDLSNIQSLGFRGEALASIASVSRLQLTSKTEDDDQAWQLSCEHSEVKPPQPAAQAQGSTVQVQDLFYNTPARRKFLRSERTEFKHIDDVVRRLALSHFETAFKLQHNGRLVFHLSPALNEQQRQQRIARLCGKDFLRHAVQLDFTAHGLRLRGWLTQPEFSRSQNDLQHFFINGRMIRDRLITHAIHQVYQEILLPGRFPGFVLDLEIDHGSVDVNVHPTKHEVRFNEARMVHDFIYMSCKNALASKPESFSINEPMQEYAGEQAYTPVWRTHSVNSHNSASISKESERMSLPLGDVIGVVHERFLLAQNQTGLVMVNLGKAREKLLKNKMRYDFDNNTIVSQPLLVPTTVSVPSTLAECCEHYADFISSLGFELGRSGPESVMLRMMPALFRDASIEQLVMQLLESTHALDTKDFSEADAHRVLQTLLHSIKESFSAWSTTQLDQLLREIEALSDPTLWCCLDDEQLQTLINPAELSKPKN